MLQTTSMRQVSKHQNNAQQISIPGQHFLSVIWVATMAQKNTEWL